LFYLPALFKDATRQARCLLELSPSAKKVQEALNAFDVKLQVLELPASTRSAVVAAQAIGCRVEQIAKSLVFRSSLTGRPVLVIASGPNRVNEKKIGELLGEPVVKADADFVRQHTGFVIGGVPPAGYSEPLTTFIDEDLLKLDEIWAAAGTPNAVFRLTPQDLLKITSGQVTNVK
jgi:prolyl-tRNA editing enzyme YbaK/EbsC (Cys-tRNA(Pro) deacylase)